MRKHSLTLCLICKNELENFPRLLNSVVGCFDEIHVTDTGSTDGTWEYLNELLATGLPGGTKLILKQFPWVNDFSKARNHSIKDVTTDYWMWMDLDDTLGNREMFLLWKDVAMPLAEYWLATYHYAWKDGKPVVSFARERVHKTSCGAKWEHFVHEGCSPTEKVKHIQYASSWTVDHQRTVADIEKDRGRNLKLFSFHDEATLNARMKFYYGKELFENGDSLNAWRVLRDVVNHPDLQVGDRLLALQFLGQAGLVLNNPQATAEAVKFAHIGLQLDPNRAEYWCVIGDAYAFQGKLREARMAYIAAMRTYNPDPNDKKVQGFIHRQAECHNLYPHKQLIKVIFNMGEFEEALHELNQALELYPDEELLKLRQECLQCVAQISRDPGKIKKCDDIVITTPPLQAYEWDEKIYRLKGVGGSETAAIEMSNWLKKLTGRRVIIFNMRTVPSISSEGVEYLPNDSLNEYFSENEPAIHIMWRHNTAVKTNARSFLWCHDLITPGVENGLNADFQICLSEFHKDYVRVMQDLDQSKIILSRNGLDPARFAGLNTAAKNPNKIVFPSSPDRGLNRAIRIVEKAREKNPDLELHVYYGLENLFKFGRAAEAEELKKMIDQRPWIKYHGNVDQSRLAQELAEAVVWLYPANFIETFCITAIECLACHVFPIARRIGALQDTLKAADAANHALLIDKDAETPEEIESWANSLNAVIHHKLWEKIEFNVQDHSWESIAREWIWLMGLDSKAENAEWKIEEKSEPILEMVTS